METDRYRFEDLINMRRLYKFNLVARDAAFRKNTCRAVSLKNSDKLLNARCTEQRGWF